MTHCRVPAIANAHGRSQTGRSRKTSVKSDALLLRKCMPAAPAREQPATSRQPQGASRKSHAENQHGTLPTQHIESSTSSQIQAASCQPQAVSGKVQAARRALRTSTRQCQHNTSSHPTTSSQSQAARCRRHTAAGKPSRSLLLPNEKPIRTKPYCDFRPSGVAGSTSCLTSLATQPDTSSVRAGHSD